MKSKKICTHICTKKKMIWLEKITF
jgi:hypothetical protein